ncbi:MAG: transposase [Planctomycetota bacterium]
MQATGRTPRDPREILNPILWVLRTGVPWRNLPERFGPWQTIWQLFDKWNRDGLLVVILNRLQADPRSTPSCGASVAPRCWLIAALRPAAKKGRRRVRAGRPRPWPQPQYGLICKTHVVCEKNGNPLYAHLTAGQAQEVGAFDAVMLGKDE